MFVAAAEALSTGFSCGESKLNLIRAIGSADVDFHRDGVGNGDCDCDDVKLDPGKEKPTRDGWMRMEECDKGLLEASLADLCMLV